MQALLHHLTVTFKVLCDFWLWNTASAIFGGTVRIKSWMALNAKIKYISVVCSIFQYNDHSYPTIYIIYTEKRIASFNKNFSYTDIAIGNGDPWMARKLREYGAMTSQELYLGLEVSWSILMTRYCPDLEDTLTGRKMGRRIRAPEVDPFCVWVWPPMIVPFFVWPKDSRVLDRTRPKHLPSPTHLQWKLWKCWWKLYIQAMQLFWQEVLGVGSVWRCLAW